MADIRAKKAATVKAKQATARVQAIEQRLEMIVCTNGLQKLTVSQLQVLLLSRGAESSKGNKLALVASAEKLPPPQPQSQIAVVERPSTRSQT